MPDDLKYIKGKLLARWKAGFFLKAEASLESIFPFTVSVKSPSALFMSENFEEVRAWIQGIKSGCAKAGLSIGWKEINHRLLGRNNIPVKIEFGSIDQLSVYLGQKTDLNKYRNSLLSLVGSFPTLSQWGSEHPFELIKYSDTLDKLIIVLSWMKEYPRPAIYLRQLALPGVDTKFIEKHKKLLSSWLDIILEPEAVDKKYTGIARFESRYGFLAKPEQVRFRILDQNESEASISVLPFNDISVPADEFAIWNPKVSRVIVIENDVTSLAFPDLPDSILIFGRGYNFGCLAQASWLNEKEIWYWGDIDTHGFAILSQFRSVFPNSESFLMGRDTLMRNRTHWGTEPKQAAPDKLPNLSQAESDLYAELKACTIKPRLRLEQEYINFDDVSNFINSLS